jgi:trimeric autotransporter adhesin
MAGGVLSGRLVRRLTAAGVVAAVVMAGDGLAVARAMVTRRPPAGTITTIAGGVGGPGPATNVSIRVCGLKSAAAALYIAGGTIVRRVDERTGRLTTVTSSIPANANADVSDACGVTADAAGNVLVADVEQVEVVAARTGRFYGRLMTAGHVYGIAGRRNKAGHAGNGGLATKALLFDAEDVTLDGAGNVVVADAGAGPDREIAAVGALVRVIAEKTGRFYGRAMIAGHIYTVAGTGSRRPERNGGLAVKAWLGAEIGQVRVDRSGNLVLADLGAWHDVGLAPSVRVIAGRTGRFYGQRMSAGHIYAIAGDGRLGYAGNGGVATRARLDYGGGVALDHAGNVVIADCDEVRVVAVRAGRLYGRPMKAGHIYAIAGQPGGSNLGYCLATQDRGDGGPAARATVAATAVGVDRAGNVLLTGGYGWRVRLIAARTGRFYGRRMRAGDIYTVAGNGNRESSGDGLLALRAELSPAAVASDRSDDVFIQDNFEARMIPAASGTYFGRRMVRGVIYRVAGGGGARPADGLVATRVSLRFIYDGPDVAADLAGNVLIADTGRNQVDVVADRTGTFYGRRMLAGRIYILAGTGTAGFSGDGGPATAATLADPDQVAIDHAGNVLTAGDIDGNLRVRAIAARSGTFYGQQMTAGDIYTIAGDGTGSYSGDGGPATEAGLVPTALAADSAGNLVIADGATCVPESYVGCRVRLVAAASGTFYGQQMTAGDIYTIAGDGTAIESGDGGPATKAGLYQPQSLAIDSAGNIAVLVASYDTNAAVRMIAARSGTFYGKKMTAGDIYTIAGAGRELRDGIPATRALLSLPLGIATEPAGNLLIAESDSGRIRSVLR